MAVQITCQESGSGGLWQAEVWPEAAAAAAVAVTIAQQPKETCFLLVTTQFPCRKATSGAVCMDQG